ncbi:hypothetical protein DY037_01160 [Apilactobacillus micheneri]|uniref:Uncharacterized protein n=2 Tax=Apilactobacillus micheneri TaxID=1899430 RepID=A0A9Q8IMR9_9LACO|nr:hypothetical protein [Apilactobacillus micheneri]TPR40017.1 hypothetical protein DY121_04050 [Apilactobacillus micheneri]TPR41828.1 hypothetical protein DY123_04670 [Apilactobacillus micheneri]TPR44219.1 hypothetical protein DY130_04045 [Apilactobacillus micheneri]TPR45843.1 hypothetical protein DY128_04045 [Apilactobacillus micheneri]TPR50587.1 hypothetical protein DY037_01160 [Apilactobacillus micheneri]
MRAVGMKIDVLRKFHYLFESENDGKKEQLKIMEEKRDDLQSAINHLHFKINNFDTHMEDTEKELKNLENNSK